MLFLKGWIIQLWILNRRWLNSIMHNWLICFKFLIRKVNLNLRAWIVPSFLQMTFIKCCINWEIWLLIEWFTEFLGLSFEQGCNICKNMLWELWIRSPGLVFLCGYRSKPLILVSILVFVFLLNLRYKRRCRLILFQMCLLILIFECCLQFWKFFLTGDLQ